MSDFPKGGDITAIRAQNKFYSSRGGKYEPLLSLYSERFWLAYSVFAIYLFAYYVYNTYRGRNSIWRSKLWIIFLVGLFVLLVCTFKFAEQLECTVCVYWCIVFCCTLVNCGHPISREKRNLVTYAIFEYLALGVLALYKSPLTFPIYMWLKTIVSLIFYIVELFMIRIRGVPTIDVKDLLLYMKDPRHSMIQVGNMPVHATTAEVEREDDGSLYPICFGISISDFNKQILEILTDNGKYNRSVVATCVLSQHKFLIYSILSHVRPGYWLLFAIATLSNRMSLSSCVEIHGEPTSHILFLCVFGFDLYNIIIEKSLSKSIILLNNVSFLQPDWKFLILCATACYYHEWGPMSWAAWGVHLYFGVSFLCWIFVNV